MKRELYPQKKVRLVGEIQRENAIKILQNAPIDTAKPLEFILREEVKPRKADQNSLMWSCQLKCIAEQAYVAGRTYSAEIWHIEMKMEFLPEDFEEGITKDGYKKWDYTSKGDRVLIGSTTQLTVKGFAEYLTKVESFGANLGVMFYGK